MFNKIKKAGQWIRRILLRLCMTSRERRIFFLSRAYLKDIGWLASFDRQSPVGPDGEALPWVTYPFIDFIKGRIEKSFEIFEFGCGNSTVFYASRSASVTAVENDREWYEKIKENAPENVALIYQGQPYGGEYCRSAADSGRKFDMIIVDGRDRVNCIKSSLTALKSGGVIILDDSEREKYEEGGLFLTVNDFKRLDFWGIPPGLFYRKCTTIFYRRDNCLKI